MTYNSYTRPEQLVTLTDLMQPTYSCVNLKEISEDPECKKILNKEQLMSDLKAKSCKTVEV